MTFINTVVTYPVKVEIFKQFTTNKRIATVINCCYLPSKGRDFQAIHNGYEQILDVATVVTYPVKVEIFKQFTTEYSNSCNNG